MAVRGVSFNSQILTKFRALGSHLIHQRTVCNVAKDSFNYCQLSKRGLLRIGGRDSVKLLQGLVTNNVELFHQDRSLRTMYSMVLNAQGRILYDTILYKDKGSSDSPCFLMECDKSALSSLSKLIKIYRLRSKVDISPIENISPWVAFDLSESRSAGLDVKQVSGVISCGKDPRTEDLGWRFLLVDGVTPSGIVDDVNESEEDAYEIHRIKLGISEGVSEIQPGVALPFEYNLDYINGVSFQKGCYIGQELTARTHHTGVIRKRLMPFTFNPPESIIRLEHGTAIKTSSGKTSGKLCIVHGQYGLGLMRLAMLTNDKQYVKDNQGQDVEICPYIPKWWPKNDQIQMHQPGTS